MKRLHIETSPARKLVLGTYAQRRKPSRVSMTHIGRRRALAVVASLPVTAAVPALAEGPNERRRRSDACSSLDWMVKLSFGAFTAYTSFSPSRYARLHWSAGCARSYYWFRHRVVVRSPHQGHPSKDSLRLPNRGTFMYDSRRRGKRRFE